MSRAPRSIFKVPSAGYTEEVGWGGRLSKWQWALAIGLPVAAAAALAGLTYLVLRRRSRDPVRGRTPPPSMSPTPVATPTSTTAAANAEARGPVTAQSVKQKGNGLFRQGKLEEAAQCYREAIDLGARDTTLIASCHQNLAAVHSELAKKTTDDELKKLHSQLVIENCDKAIALDPRYVKALLRRFKMHQALGNLEDALLDVTRVLLLDESHAQSLSSSVTSLLKDLSLTDAAKNFPSLGPLAPTKYLVKTYAESYIWRDDISEDRLKTMWLEVHPPLTDSQPTASNGDRTQVDKAQDETEATVVAIETRVIDGEGEEEEAAGGSGEVGEEPGKGGGGVEETGKDGGEEGEGGNEEEEGKEKNGEIEKDVKEQGEKKEDENAENGEVVVSETVQTEESEMTDRMTGFSDEPYVKAAGQFVRYDLSGILELLTKAINTGHTVFKAHALLLRGTLQALWRMESEALRDLQEVINTQGLPNEMYVNALIKRAGIFAGQQNMNKCRTCLEKALTICPDSIDILVHRARVYLESEEVSNLDTVVEDLSRAVERAPDQPYPIYSLASSFHRLASLSQSMQLIETARFKFQEALKRFPNFADGLVLYALFLQDTGDFTQAEKILNKAVQVEPDNPLGYFSLGLLNLVVRSDIDQTMVYMQKAIGVDISCVQAYDTIASIEMQRGNTKKAMELYEKAVHYSRNQVEMTQAYVAQKVFSMQDRVCKEYGVSIQQLAARSAAMTPTGPNT